MLPRPFLPSRESLFLLAPIASIRHRPAMGRSLCACLRIQAGPHCDPASRALLQPVSKIKEDRILSTEYIHFRRSVAASCRSRRRAVSKAARYRMLHLGRDRRPPRLDRRRCAMVLAGWWASRLRTVSDRQPGGGALRPRGRSTVCRPASAKSSRCICYSLVHDDLPANGR